MSGFDQEVDSYEDAMAGLEDNMTAIIFHATEIGL
jgi:hypothetical protein